MWKWKSLSCVQPFVTPWTIYSSGQNTGVGSRPLLQGISPTQGFNPGLLHCRRILYHLSHQRSPQLKYRLCLKAARSKGEKGLMEMWVERSFHPGHRGRKRTLLSPGFCFYLMVQLQGGSHAPCVTGRTWRKHEDCYAHPWSWTIR